MKFIRSIALFVLSGYGFLSLSSCSGKGDQAGEYRNTDSPVLITLGKPGDTGGTGFSISGQVEASQTANISTRVMGIHSKLKVKAGDAVNKEQLIATISNSDIIAKRAQTDAMITEAKATSKECTKRF